MTFRNPGASKPSATVVYRRTDHGVCIRSDTAPRVAKAAEARRREIAGRRAFDKSKKIRKKKRGQAARHQRAKEKRRRQEELSP